MDLNRFPILLTPVVLQVQFVCRPKTELRNIIVQDRGECTYQAFFEIIISFDCFQNPQQKLVILYLYLREDYIEDLLFF
jgi:hypothetical protein